MRPVRQMLKFPGQFGFNRGRAQVAWCAFGTDGLGLGCNAINAGCNRARAIQLEDGQAVETIFVVPLGVARVENGVMAPHDPNRELAAR